MKRSAIKNDQIDRNKILSVLNYDEEKKEFTIDIPEYAVSNELPFVMAAFWKRGLCKVSPEWSMRWVQSRIVPHTRQNIGQILRANGMKRYDEYALLVKNQGRCCQDEPIPHPCTRPGLML